MDKASIIKDAISYIQQLHEQERQIKAEISELEFGRLSRKNNSNYNNNSSNNNSMDLDYHGEQLPASALLRSKKKRTDHRRQFHDSDGCGSPIEDLQVSSLIIYYYYYYYYYYCYCYCYYYYLPIELFGG